LSPAALAKLKLPELRDRCLSAGLSPDGKKADLVARLTAAAEGGGEGGGADGDEPSGAVIDAADPMAALLRELDSMGTDQLAGELTARGVPLPAGRRKGALVEALAELLMREATEALAATEAAATTEAAAEQADARIDELAALSGRPSTLAQSLREGLDGGLPGAGVRAAVAGAVDGGAQGGAGGAAGGRDGEGGGAVSARARACAPRRRSRARR
jgi:hypothetical protein